MKTLLKLCLLFFVFPLLATAQPVTVEGYVFEENNRGYLNLVAITVLDKATNAIKANASTNKEGFFTVDLPKGATYIIRAEKDLFDRKEVELSIPPAAKEKLYTKVEMKRKPGYIFDVTIAEIRDDESTPVDAISGSRIEVYNNTKDEEALVLEAHESPAFQFTFEQGNHYTIMIRKKGYFTKRMEAYVNVKGCILCFDGIGNVQPGVTDNLTEGHQMGTLLANVEMIPIKINESIAVENIYYDLGKWNIRPDAAKELDKLIIVLKDNPAVVVELGSHTDSRGSDGFNMELSEKRARAAVDFIIEKGVDADRISAKGYGETALVNKCANGVKCSELEHQKNRRTSLKIIGMRSEDPLEKMSLAEIIEAEKFDKMLKEIQNQEVVKIEEGEEIPDYMKQTEKPESKPPKQQEMTVEEPLTTPVRETVSTAREEVVTRPVKEAAENTTTSYQEQTSPGNADYLRTANIEVPEANSMIVEEVEVESALRHLAPRRIAPDFSGYKIEVMTLNSELPLSHVLFKRHGNLCIEQLNGGKYAYLLGVFKTETQATGFMEKILISRYPNAKVVGFENGRRI